MARVIWDGEKIVLDSSRLDSEEVNNVCKKHNGNKLPFSSFIEFSRNKNVVKDIGSISGIVMDESFKKLYDVIIRSEQNKSSELEDKIKQMNLPETMYPFQKEDVVSMTSILENKRNILLSEPQGTGKSCITSVFISRNNLFPCLIVCPASLKLNWKMEINKWIPDAKAYIISGRTSYLDSYTLEAVRNADIVIINYDILGEDDKEASQKEKERIEKAKENGWKYRKAFIPVNGWAVEFQKKFNFKSIVCDECFVKNTKVLTEFGYVNIQNIKVGDNVLSVNTNGEIEVKRVTAIKKQLKKTNFVTVKNEFGNIVKCTDNHKFFTEYEKCVPISTLQNQDSLLSYVYEVQEEDKYELEPNDIRDIVRRWVFSNTYENVEKSEIGDFSFNKERRLCNEKIRIDKGILQSATEKSEKWWLGWGPDEIYNKMLSKYVDVLSIILRKWKIDYKKRNFRFDDRRSTCLLVYGRWFFRWYAEIIYICLFLYRTANITKMVVRKIWNKFKDFIRQTKKIIFFGNWCRRKEQNVSYDRKIHSSFNEVQNTIFRYESSMLCLRKFICTLSQSYKCGMFKSLSDYTRKTICQGILSKTKIVKETKLEKHYVYDITVEDNHNFIANGFLVHNCQYIESPKAIRSRAVIQVCSDNRILKVFLSGTPFETKLRQFYNACHILASDLFPSESKFLFTYCNPKKGYFGWTFDGVSNLDEFRRKTSLFTIRHKKEEVLPQLPSKQNIPIYFEIEPKIRKTYDDMEDELLSKEEGLHQFSYLAEMRKALINIKKDSSVQYVKDILEIEDKVVVFVYHTEMYEYFMNKFSDIAVGFNGGVANFKRQDAINKFQNDKKVRLFIGQIDAAATGITLTASHTLIFVEFGKTAAQIDQAADRIHRIGQKENCQIYYLIVKDTIDETPLKYLSNHFQDIHAVMDGDNEVQMIDMNKATIASVKERVLMRKKKGIKIEYNSEGD